MADRPTTEPRTPMSHWWHRLRQGHDPVWIEGAFDQIGWDRYCERCSDRSIRRDILNRVRYMRLAHPEEEQRS